MAECFACGSAVGDDSTILADPVRGTDGLETEDARDTRQMGADA
jgi:hypothetical protein